MIPAELSRGDRNGPKRKVLKPIAVITSAGTVNTGAIDPLEEIAAIASARNIWLHVDEHTERLPPSRGREIPLKADSITLDPHKWLFSPWMADVFVP